MIRMTAIALTALGLGACAFPVPYDPEPNSPAQWERRQEDIARREAERVRLCAIMNTDTDRYRRDCRRPGDPVR
jgi:hypothetical protein